jgi:hypothetical protein
VSPDSKTVLTCQIRLKCGCSASFTRGLHMHAYVYPTSYPSFYLTTFNAASTRGRGAVVAYIHWQQQGFCSSPHYSAPPLFSGGGQPGSHSLTPTHTACCSFPPLPVLFPARESPTLQHSAERETWYSRRRSFAASGSATGAPGSPRSGTLYCKPQSLSKSLAPRVAIQLCPERYINNSN